MPLDVQNNYINQVDIESIPPGLRAEQRWVLWKYEERDGKRTKVPQKPSGQKASSTDPQSWVSFEEALSALKNDFQGLGFVLGDGWVGLDFDQCLTSEVPSEVWELVNALDGYAEISPSGRGVHIICRGKLPKGPRRFTVSWAKGAEIYDQGRFFTVTGKALHLGDLASDRSEALARVYSKLDLENLKVKWRENKRALKLIEGDISDYPSHSEADLALCSYLLVYTAGDVERADRIFRCSGLYRPKWDERHSADGRTYGQITLEKAARGEKLAAIGQNFTESLEERLESEFTDRNNARILAQLLKGKALYVASWGWCVWDGKRWSIDHENAQVISLARELLPKYYLDRAAREPDAGVRIKLCEFAKKAHSRDKLVAALDLARGDLLADPKDFDANLWLLNCANGVLDLRSGELKPHDPELKLSKLCPIAYNPQAQAPRWGEFIRDITLEDGELSAFLQRALGYSITGDVREDKLFICWGSGANGKSTLLQTIRRVLGDYAKTIAPDTLLKKRGDTHPTAVADLHGVRFAIAIETDEDQFLAEARVKALTGRDAIKARYLHRNYFEFEPQAKIWLATNHRPVVRDTSYAMWRRLALIPFRAFFPLKRKTNRCPKSFGKSVRAFSRGLCKGACSGSERGLESPT